MEIAFQHFIPFSLFPSTQEVVAHHKDMIYYLRLCPSRTCDVFHTTSARLEDKHLAISLHKFLTLK